MVTWNIHRCIGLDGAYRPERIVKVLRSFNADIIALQEVDSSLLVTTHADQLEYLSKELGLEAVMGPTLRSDYGSYGNAILTKHEIMTCEEHDLSFRRFEPRGALAVRLQYHGRNIRFLNTHLGLKYWERVFQVDRLLSQLVWDESDHIVIVAGDFNEWFPWTNNNLRLERSFSWGSKRAATFPSHWPRFALDRIFVHGEIADVKSEIHSSPEIEIASDHLPVMVDLELGSK